MTIPAVYLPEAEEDIARAWTSYEHERVGLGDRFAAAAQDMINQICDNPQLYGVFRRHVRAAPMRAFPYVIYYQDRGTDVLIVAVQHGRRCSRRWRGRL